MSLVVSQWDQSADLLITELHVASNLQLLLNKDSNMNKETKWNKFGNIWLLGKYQINYLFNKKSVSKQFRLFFSPWNEACSVASGQYLSSTLVRLKYLYSFRMNYHDILHFFTVPKGWILLFFHKASPWGRYLWFWSEMFLKLSDGLTWNYGHTFTSPSGWFSDFFFCAIIRSGI